MKINMLKSNYISLTKNPLKMRAYPNILFESDRIYAKNMRIVDLKDMIEWEKYDDVFFEDYNFFEMSFKEKNKFLKYKTSSFKRCYSLFEKETNRVIGYLSLRKLNPILKSAEIGISMDKAMTSKGYGSEILKSFIEYFFKEFKYNKITLMVADFNERAKKCYDSLGFEYVKTKFYPQLFVDENLFKEDMYKSYKKYFFEVRGIFVTKFFKMKLCKTKWEKSNLSTKK